MTAGVITSRRNPLIQEFREIKKGSQTALIFLEGPRLASEALAASVSIESAIFSSDERSTDLQGKISKCAKRTITVSPQVFEVLSDVKEPQGIAVVCRKPRWEWQDIVAK